ncbi:hypothetical protein J7L00_05270 [Candidatus Bathyarchaeota archaeon]|nr:hypothetical protein [Candidatus Bathyarchaeota archaeon]
MSGICRVCGKKIWWGEPRAVLVKEIMYIAGSPEICERCFWKIIKHAEKVKRLLEEVEENE